MKKGGSFFDVRDRQLLKAEGKLSIGGSRVKVQIEPLVGTTQPQGASQLQRQVYDLLTQDRRIPAFELLADVQSTVSQKDFSDAVFYLGRFLLRNNLPQECFIMLKSMHETFQRVYPAADSRMYEEMGNMLHLSGQYAEAIDWFSRMLEAGMAPEAKMCFNIGLCYELLQNYAKAIEYYYKATNAEPKHTKAWLNLGTCYLKTAVYDKAINAFGQIPTSVESLTCLGNVYFQMGNYEEAVANYLRALEVGEADCHVLNNLGCALKKLELFEDALNAFNDSLAVKPSTEAVVNLLTLNMELGRLDEAKRMFSLAEKYVPASEAKSLLKVYDELKRGEDERQAGGKTLKRGLMGRVSSIPRSQSKLV